jgi:ferredoxin
MQLAPQEMKENETMADRGDCLKCGLCTKACPKSALSLPG